MSSRTLIAAILGIGAVIAAIALGVPRLEAPPSNAAPRETTASATEHATPAPSLDRSTKLAARMRGPFVARVNEVNEPDIARARSPERRRFEPTFRSPAPTVASLKRETDLDRLDRLPRIDAIDRAELEKHQRLPKRRSSIPHADVMRAKVFELQCKAPDVEQRYAQLPEPQRTQLRQRCTRLGVTLTP